MKVLHFLSWSSPPPPENAGTGEIEDEDDEDSFLRSPAATALFDQLEKEYAEQVCAPPVVVRFSLPILFYSSFSECTVQLRAASGAAADEKVEPQSENEEDARPQRQLSESLVDQTPAAAQDLEGHAEALSFARTGSLSSLPLSLSLGEPMDGTS